MQKFAVVWRHCCVLNTFVYVEYLCHVCIHGVGVMWVVLIVAFIKPSVCAAVPVCMVF